MPISGWQWAALMNDGPYNWCAQHSAWGSWISGLEHTAKLICFVKDGRRGEGRLLSFRQERSTWCQERRRCSSCCLCCSPTTPPPLHPIAIHHPSPPHRHQSTHTSTYPHACVCVHTHKYTSQALSLHHWLHRAQVLPLQPMPLCHHATLSHCQEFFLFFYFWKEI